jgi:CDP-4-dehydro-6-deoxyglucose reductase
MFKVTMLSGKAFDAQGGQSILEAAEDAGNSLPYSCRTGRCSSCKCRIVGPTTLKFDELGLTDAEKQSGWKLTCARVPTGDVKLDINDLGDIDLPKSKVVPAKIDQLTYLTDDILKLCLRLPPKAQFRFIPGQYINLIGKNGLQRSYSLASDSNGQVLEMHVRRVPNGIMSEHLFENAKVDDLLRISGPHGTFVLRPLAESDLIFVATGTGIGPVKSMIEQIESMPADQVPQSIKILWGMRREGEIYWSPRDKLRQVDFIPVLSKAADSWNGERGYVQDVLFRSDVITSQTYIYACGSEAMINATRSMALSAGLTEEHFYSDSFVASN